ncbi:glycoside hydrolase family 3 N-terminal domain-containing protein [Ohtaekwangia sp.]|uniref:glycoside hydrolase family 3 N-terminal domain-containing protein n=1 Tax=Ohtaekwangia sp. TaxID=2066019 RepID=UPI002FDDE652
MKRIAGTWCLSLVLMFVFQAQQPVQPVSANERAEALLAKMTLEEKVGQMAQVTLDVITKGESEYVSDEPLQIDMARVKKALIDYKIGSVLNTANNRARSTEKWHEIISQIQEVATKETRLKIPVIYGIDAIHGATYTAGATFFPQQIAQAATWNRALVKHGAEICAYETRASAIPWSFSPVLDLGRDPRFPRLWETFGEDVYLTSELGKQMVEGYEGKSGDVKNPQHVASTLKHFLGYQVPQSGKDRTPAFIPEIELRERHLPAFKAAIDAGAHSIMINSGLINGIPVHADQNILTKLLKEELGFKGVVVTDWKDIENLHDRDKVATTQKEAVKLAINAGIDMSMIPYNFRFCDYLIELVKEGEVPMSRIDDAVRRILTLKFDLGLFEKPVTNFKDYPEFGSKAFEQSAYQAASEAITLLKNNNNLLPFRKTARILVTGPNANTMRALNGGWSYSWQGEKADEFGEKYNTILEALQLKGGKQNITFIQGVAYNNGGKYWEEKDVDIDAAVKAAASVDYIVACVGENSYTEKPGDLHDLTLSANQLALVKALNKTGKPVILVLNEGRPRLISAIEKDVQAVVHLYLPGNLGGDAAADVLYGNVNPSGKLPYTYPMYANTLVTYDHKPSEEQNKMQGVYDYESDFAIQYPFGFGLSYTSFTYSDLQVSKASFTPDEKITVSVTVKNTGSREGKEVVQLFVSDLYASVTPDVKRLRGFEKITLKPGESQKVTFTLGARDIAFVGKDLHWIVEKGEYEVNIGTLKSKFSLTEAKTFREGAPQL